ncbi:MAG: hypothetical protein ABI481_00635 [Pyrinomonadaceae bacterium]
MANQKNRQDDQSESTPKNQNNVSEFSPQSPKGGSFSAGTNAPSTGATSAGGAPQGSTSDQTRGSGQSNPSGQGMSSGGGAATATARSFIDQAKDTAGQAYEAVTEKATTTLDQRKTTLTSGLTSVADSVRQVSENLSSSKTESGLAEAAAKYTGTAAQKLQDAAGYFESRNVRDMARDLEGFARRNPALFFGTAFGLGILAARFLKSSPTTYNDAGVGREIAPGSVTSDRQLNAPSPRGGTPDFSTNKV